MLTPIANCHHSKLPRLGAIVAVKIKPPAPGRRYRKFVVESFPLTDAAGPRFSRGIHTCTVRALDNNERCRVSGFYCQEVD